MENKTLVIIGIAAAFFLCLCLIGVLAVLTFIGPAVSTTTSVELEVTGDLQGANDRFLAYLRDGEFQDAFHAMHPDLQLEVEGVRAFQWELEDAYFSVDTWTVTSSSSEDDYGHVEGQVTDKDGDKWEYVLEFVYEGERWQLITYDFDFIDRPQIQLT